jgi:hypothetical protein
MAMTNTTSATTVQRRTLRDIGADLIAIDNLIEETGGEIVSPEADAALTAWMTANMAEESKKMEGYFWYVRALETEAAVLKAEADQLARQAKARAARVEWLLKAVFRHIKATGRTEIVTEKGHAFKVTKNGGNPPLKLAEDIDPETLEERFLVPVVPVRRKVDADAVRAALNAGEVLAWASIEKPGEHLRVK